MSLSRFIVTSLCIMYWTLTASGQGTHVTLGGPSDKGRIIREELKRTLEER